MQDSNNRGENQSNFVIQKTINFSLFPILIKTQLQLHPKKKNKCKSGRRGGFGRFYIFDIICNNEIKVLAKNKAANALISSLQIISRVSYVLAKSNIVLIMNTICNNTKQFLKVPSNSNFYAYCFTWEFWKQLLRWNIERRYNNLVGNTTKLLKKMIEDLGNVLTGNSRTWILYTKENQLEK